MVPATPCHPRPDIEPYRKSHPMTCKVDTLPAVFREHEWLEEECDEQFVARGSRRAFEDTEKRDAVKSFISSLLVRVKHEECQKFLRDIEQTKESFLAIGSTPEEKVLAM